MRMKRPRPASRDEITITRDGEVAIVEFADDRISTTHLTIGPELAAMTDDEVLDLFNATLAAQARIAAGFDRTAVEIPPGRPQIEFHEASGQWVPRGRILRCHIEDDFEGKAVIYVDDQELDLAAFGRLLTTYAGWGMRIAFVPDDEVDEDPPIVVRDP